MGENPYFQCDPGFSAMKYIKKTWELRTNLEIENDFTDALSITEPIMI